MELSYLNLEYLNYWNSILPLSTNDDTEFLNLIRLKYRYNSIQNTISLLLCNKLFSKYLLDISDHNVLKFFAFKETATEHIHDLFLKHVNSDTIILTTLNEHASVKKELQTFKHTNQILIFRPDEIERLDFKKLQTLKTTKNSNFLIYCASIWITQGINVDEVFITQLKNKLMLYKCITILDDVQGMFLYPRKYELYDYIIGTAHALIRGFNMGILISHNLQYDIQIQNTDLFYYFELLDIMLKRKEKLFLFKFAMTQTLANIIKIHKWKILDCVPSYFSAETDIKYSKDIDEFFRKKFNIFIEADPNDKDLTAAYLRFRGAQFIEFQENLETGLKLLEQYINTDYII